MTSIESTCTGYACFATGPNPKLTKTNDLASVSSKLTALTAKVDQLPQLQSDIKELGKQLDSTNLVSIENFEQVFKQEVAPNFVPDMQNIVNGMLNQSLAEYVNLSDFVSVFKDKVAVELVPAVLKMFDQRLMEYGLMHEEPVEKTT